jgi:2,3-bisphosphoglycerate-independent phosphoglycerate mutase
VQEARRVLAGAEVNRARERRGRPPANAVLTRDAGNRLPELPSMKQRTGADWGCFAEMPVERGIALVTGMDPIQVPRPEEMAERYRAWAELAVEALGGYDALYVHIKGPDLPAHDGDGARKRDVISLIDEAFFGELLSRLPLARTVLAVTADHATSSARRAHTDYPVPLLLAGGGVSPDGSTSFGEREAARGGLGMLAGAEVVPLLVQAARG